MRTLIGVTLLRFLSQDFPHYKQLVIEYFNLFVKFVRENSGLIIATLAGIGFIVLFACFLKSYKAPAATQNPMVVAT